MLEECSIPDMYYFNNIVSIIFSLIGDRRDRRMTANERLSLMVPLVRACTSRLTTASENSSLTESRGRQYSITYTSNIASISKSV